MIPLLTVTCEPLAEVIITYPGETVVDVVDPEPGPPGATTSHALKLSVTVEFWQTVYVAAPDVPFAAAIVEVPLTGAEAARASPVPNTVEPRASVTAGPLAGRATTVYEAVATDVQPVAPAKVYVTLNTPDGALVGVEVVLTKGDTVLVPGVAPAMVADTASVPVTENETVAPAQTGFGEATTVPVGSVLIVTLTGDV